MMTARQETDVKRRTFLKNASITAVGATTYTLLQPRHVRGAQANSKVHLGIIGTGGRGQHDGRNLLKTGKVKIVALADYFDFQMEDPARQFEVDPSRCFDGIDGYKKIMALDDVDAVLLTTPPYFRPIHFEAAVDAGKHVFAEKPIAIDPWGCRKFLATGKEAEHKKITVGAGLQSRYDEGRQDIRSGWAGISGGGDGPITSPSVITRSGIGSIFCGLRGTSSSKCMCIISISSIGSRVCFL